MDAFAKVFIRHDLYDATEEEIKELENSLDPTVRRETKDIFRPIFDDIQKEKVKTRFTGEVVIRPARKGDFEDIIRLSRRVNWTDNRTGIRSFSLEDLNVTLKTGIMFVATIPFGYIAGVSSMLVGDYKGKKCGYESTTMVSRLFRRKGIGQKLFYKRIEWAGRNNLTHINTRHLSEEGFEFLKAIQRKRQDLEFVINRFGTSSIIIKP